MSFSPVRPVRLHRDYWTWFALGNSVLNNRELWHQDNAGSIPPFNDGLAAMLKGIPPVISPELMSILMRMGHGDDLVIADGNFPAEAVAQRLVRCDGHGVAALLDAVLQFLPIDDFIETPLRVMERVDRPELEPPIWQEFREIVTHHEQRIIPLARLTRFDFYQQARQAFAVVATGETAVYANVILTKGVVRPQTSPGPSSNQP